MKHITTAAALLALVSAPALGNPLCTDSESSCITVNGTIGGVTFTAAPGNALEVSSLGFQGTAAYNPAMGSSDTGVAVFGPTDFITGSLMTPPPAGLDPPPPPPAPSTSPYFPASGPQSFTYQANDDPDNPSMGVNLDALSMGIIWTSLVPNAPMGEPQLFGTGVITAIQGDDTFTSDFGMIGDLVNIFANFPLTGPPCDLTELATGSEACSGAFQIVASFEGGDATPAGGGGGPGGGGMMPVPEPMSSFIALGLALCCLWGTYQLTRRERRHLGASA